MIRQTYTTRRLIIRPYLIKDYPLWFEVYSNSGKKKSKYDLSQRPLSICRLKDFKGFIKRHKHLAQKDQTYIWGIFEKKSTKLVGTLDIHILVRDKLQKANLGYRIFNMYWKRGFAAESVKKICKSSLLDLKLNRLEAVIDTDNKPSIKLAKSIDLKFEAIRRNYYYQAKTWADQVVYVTDRKSQKLPKLNLNI